MKSKHYRILLSAISALNILVVTNAQTAFAQDGYVLPPAEPSPYYETTPQDNNVKNPAKNRSFSMDLGAGIGWGHMGVSQGDLPGRSMSYFGLTAFPMYRLNNLIESLPFPLKVGVSAEYRFVGQLTDSSSLAGNSNFRGDTFVLGIGAQGDFQKFSVSATFDFVGSHSFSNASLGHTNAGYSAPLGFRLTGTYEAAKNFFPGIAIGYEGFSTFKEDGNSIDASSDRLSDFTIGVVANYRFNF